MATFNTANKVLVANPSANVDWKYGPWNSTTEAKDNVVEGLREKGLTVGIVQGDGSIAEYWWKSGITNTDLVLKTSGSGGGTAPTADNVDAALSNFTEGTPQDSDFLVFIGKLKITLANFKTLLVTAFTNTFAAKTHTHAQSDITNLTEVLSGKQDALGFTPEEAGVAADLVTALKNGVASEGDTLKKLYDLIVASFSEVTVADTTARNNFNVTKLPTNIFVTNDGDSKWALYKCTTLGTNRGNDVKISDPDLLNAVMSASQIKTSYESNDDTNAFTDALLDKLNAFTATFTSELKTAYDAAATASHSHTNKTILDAIASTPESVSNKSTNIETDKASDTKYVSVKAIYDWTLLKLEEKQTTFPGISQVQFLTENDIVIDCTSATPKLTIATVRNGETISASNPICFYTDGNGQITKHVKTSPVVFNFTYTTGVWYFYFDSSGNPVAIQTPWTNFETIATVYRLYLNASLSGAERDVIESVEYHKNDISAADHAWKHNEGTKHISGFDLTHGAIASGTPAADGSNTCIALSSGTNLDDNLLYTVTHNANPTLKFQQDLGSAASITAGARLITISNNGQGGPLIKIPATRFPFLFNPTTNVPQFLTTAGVRTDVTSGNYFVYYVYSLQDPRVGETVKLKSAEVQFATLQAAEAHTWETLQSLFPTLKDNEIRLFYKLIFQTVSSGGQAYPAAVKYAALRKVEDRRKQILTSSATLGGSLPATSVVTTIANGVTEANAQLELEKINLSITNLTKLAKAGL